VRLAGAAHASPQAVLTLQAPDAKLAANPTIDAANPIPFGWWFPVLIGLIGGVATMMANAAGPIMIIYLLGMRMPKTQFVGTWAWFFLLVNAIKVPFSASPELGLINPHSLQFNLILSPLIIGGAIAGARLVKYLPQKTFTKWMQIFAVLGALQLLLSIGGSPDQHR
jgi:uncharacterized membrane protein YfcA